MERGAVEQIADEAPLVFVEYEESLVEQLLSVEHIESGGEVDAEYFDCRMHPLDESSHPFVCPDGVSCAAVGAEAALCRREKLFDPWSNTTECDDGEQFSQRREQHDWAQVVHRTFWLAWLLQYNERAHADADVLVVLDGGVEDIGEAGVQCWGAILEKLSDSIYDVYVI